MQLNFYIALQSLRNAHDTNRLRHLLQQSRKAEVTLATHAKLVHIMRRGHAFKYQHVVDMSEIYQTQLGFNEIIVGCAHNSLVGGLI